MACAIAESPLIVSDFADRRQYKAPHPVN